MNSHERKAGDGPEMETVFYVRILFRQNASWQGTIQWLNGKKTVPFRSILELAILMKEALVQVKSLEEPSGFLVWENKEEVS